MIDLLNFATESRNDKTRDLDMIDPLEIITLMNQEDENVILAVKSQLDKIAKVIVYATESLYNDARIIYMGAGTSGRLGVLDAVECPPTFGVGYDKVIGLIAGGDDAFVKAKEGAEDDESLGQHDLKKLDLSPKDIVIGIAASGRTPYVIGGLKYALKIGSKTVTISNNKNSEIGQYADIKIEAVTGPEVLTGSTRLKAGSAQKMILNMISTGAMVGYGKAYQNLMVDVKLSNEKLVARAINIIVEATGSSKEVAKETLVKANNSVKLAIVMIMFDVDLENAKRLLDDAKGHIRKIIKETEYVK